jgi:protein-S-isoprenylcysteine O-methyltransferase Ste14
MPRSEQTNVPKARRGHEYSERSRSVVLMLLAPIFLVALPAMFIGLGARLDQQMDLPPGPPPPVNLIVGLPLILGGGALGLWCNYRLVTVGRGTPLPLMPTQELIIEPPYTWSRNPMALGAIGLYLGVAILARSLGAVLVVLLCAAALLTYIRLSEERVMAARFGAQYLQYRRRTPFLLPRMWSLRRGR